MDNWRDNDQGNILMQYTGLHDKNGKEIYEGDIVGGVYEPSYIGWCNKCASLQLMTDQINDYGPCQQCEGDVSWRELTEEESIEIIGNIYETPELLNPSSR